MSTTPPRRRRPSAARTSSFPLLPIGIGIIVIGFIIGAGLSVVARRGAGDGVAYATASPSADVTHAGRGAAAPTPIPAVARTPPPADTPEPSAAPTARPRATATAVRTATPRRSAAIALAPSPVASAAVSPPVTAATTSAPRAAPQSTSALTSVPSVGTPAPRRTPAVPVATASPAVSAAPATALAPPPGGTLDADSEFARLAGNVVRQYLLSLSRGDSESAYAALGEPPGSRPDAVPEAGAVDATTRISRIVARGGAGGATVSVDLSTGGGAYYGQYTVRRSATGAAIIVSHTFGKV